MEEVGHDGGDAGPNGGGGRGPRPRGVVTGGWGFEDASGGQGPGPGLSAEMPSPAGVPTGGAQRRGHFDDDDAVPTIPDLEEEAEDDITRQVAAPPASGGTFSAQPVRSVRELDSALASRGMQLPASPEPGVDLAPLMQCLCSERQVFEPDTTWDPELIFQEVASGINAELTAAEDAAGEAVAEEAPLAPSSDL